MGFYSKYILPPLLSNAMGAKPIRYQRKKVVPQAEGDVLEVGIGAGHNLAFYDPAKVKRVIGLEPAPEMRARAAKAAEGLPFPVSFTDLKAEDIDLPDASVDTALVTYTFCTIPDVPKALSAIARVLKPGAKLIFCEHGQAPDANVQKWQRRIEPFWKRIAGGCHLCRPIPQLIENGGFRIESLETMYLPGTPKFAGFNYWGRAVRD